jgi:hypothetical protein
VRDYAAAKGLEEAQAVTAGMAEQATVFTEQGAELYPRA